MSKDSYAYFLHYPTHSMLNLNFFFSLLTSSIVSGVSALGINYFYGIDNSKQKLKDAVSSEINKSAIKEFLLSKEEQTTLLNEKTLKLDELNKELISLNQEKPTIEESIVELQSKEANYSQSLIEKEKSLNDLTEEEKAKKETERSLIEDLERKSSSSSTKFESLKKLREEIEAKTSEINNQNTLLDEAKLVEIAAIEAYQKEAAKLKADQIKLASLSEAEQAAKDAYEAQEAKEKESIRTHQTKESRKETISTNYQAQLKVAEKEKEKEKLTNIKALKGAAQRAVISKTQTKTRAQKAYDNNLNNLAINKQQWIKAHKDLSYSLLSSTFTAIFHPLLSHATKDENKIKTSLSKLITLPGKYQKIAHNTPIFASALSKADKSLSDALKVWTSHKNTCTGIEKQLEQENQKTAILKTEYDSIVSESASLITSLQTSKEETQRLLEVYNQTKTSKDSFQKTLDSLTSKVDELLNKKEEAEKESKSLTDTLNKINSDKTQLEDKKTTLEGESSSANSETKDTEEKLKTIQARLSELSAVIVSLNTSIEEETKLKVQTTLTIETAKASLSTTLEALATKTEEIESITAEITTLDEYLANLTTNISILQEEATI